MQSVFKDMIVLELASVLAGPSVGMFFAELGATVVKVENPGTNGDVTRSWKIPGEDIDSDISAYFAATNWGKRSIALNAANPDDYRVISQLLAISDVVIVSFKPGDEFRLNLDYEIVRAINPNIIYAQITGYGVEDSRVGYDAILQAAGGFTYMNGAPDGPPTKMPVALVDLLAAHQLKEGVLAALLNRAYSGEGEYLHISLLAAGAASLANQATNWLNTGRIPARMGSEHPNIVPYGTAMTTRDQKNIVLGIGSDRQFRRFCRILGDESIADDARYATNAVRVQHRNELLALLSRKVGEWDCDDLMKALQDAHIPAGPILNMEEVFQQPPCRELIVGEENDDASPVKGVRSIAFQWGRNYDPDARPPLSSPPGLNADYNYVMKELLNRPDHKNNE